MKECQKIDSGGLWYATKIGLPEGPTEYITEVKCLTYKTNEHKKFVKFFKQVEQDRLEVERTKALTELLPYWQEDIEASKRKADEMFAQAAQTLESINN